MKRTVVVTRIVLGLGLSVALTVGCGGGQDPTLETESQALWSQGTPACGATLATYDGVNAYSNYSYNGNDCLNQNCVPSGTNCAIAPSNNQLACGCPWQCVELVSRYMLTKGWGARIYANAIDVCTWVKNNPSSGYVTNNVPSASAPGPGDALIWSNAHNGHIALVQANGGGVITTIQQNIGNSTGYAATDTVTWNGSTFGGSSTNGAVAYGTPVCWIHATANTPCSPAPIGVPGSGNWCGNDQMTCANANTLYNTTCYNAGCYVNYPTPCTNGCTVVGNGNDYCTPSPPFCGPNNSKGWYCGSDGMSNAAPNTLYHCPAPNSNADPNPTPCASGCQVAPPGWADYCYNLHNPGNGWWCGYDVTQGYANHLYYWSGGNHTDKGNCVNGCVVPCPTCSDKCR